MILRKFWALSVGHAIFDLFAHRDVTFAVLFSAGVSFITNCSRRVVPAGVQYFASNIIDIRRREEIVNNYMLTLSSSPYINEIG